MSENQSAYRRLGSLAAVRLGHQTRKRIKPSACGAYFLLQIRDFNPARTRFDPAGLARINAGEIRNDQLLHPGDLVFLAKGTRNFSYAIESLPGPTLAAAYFFVVRPTPEVRPGYLAWFLNLESTQRDLARQTGFGANMPVVRRNVLENLQVALPDLRTQETILELTGLMMRQQKLLAELAEKQKTLYTTACMQAAIHQPLFSPAATGATREEFNPAP